MVDRGLLRARGDPGGGGGGGQAWSGGDGDPGGNEPWGDFGEPSTWSEGTPTGSAAAMAHLGPHIVLSLLQILLLP